MVEQSSRSLEDRFTRVFESNMWLDGESISGPGSRIGSDPVIEALYVLKNVCERHAIGSILDVPCGDLNWISRFLQAHGHLAYLGCDIVKPLIERNRKAYPELDCRFLDITKSVPQAADLVLCKDLLIHLELDDVLKVLRNIKASGSRYLLLSNNFGQPNSALNEHLYGDSVCRYVDIMTTPFSCTPPIWHSSYLGLWKLSDTEFA